MTLYDKKTVQKFLTQALELKGKDHTVENCTYFELADIIDDDGFCVEEVMTNRPACIVGVVSIITGNKKLQELLKDSNDEGIDTIEGVEEFFTPGALSVLSAVQVRQDSGWTWGASVASARKA